MKSFIVSNAITLKSFENMVKLVCFDLWETLVTEPSTFEDIWRPFAAAYPEKVSWLKIHELIARVAQRKDQPIERSIMDILSEFDVRDNALFGEISKRWKHSCDQVTPFPETFKALQNLRDVGFKLGLLTNTSRYGWEAADKKLSLNRYFDYLALSFKVGRVKPEPEIFQYMEKESGFSGREITMVGDSYKSDFEAPRGVGWSSILLERKASKHPEARPVVHDLLQIREMIVGL